MAAVTFTDAKIDLPEDSNPLSLFIQQKFNLVNLSPGKINFQQ